MVITVSNRARAFIRERGGTVYVYDDPKTVNESTERPEGRTFSREDEIDGVKVTVEDDLNHLLLDVRLSWPGEPRLYVRLDDVT